MDQAQARSILLEKNPELPEKVEEYIQEAEHQDGPAYWTNVARTPERLLHDFELYVEASSLLAIQNMGDSVDSGEEEE